MSAAAAAAAGAAPLVTAAFLLLPLRLLSLAFGLRLPTFPPSAPVRRSAAALLTVAALLAVTCAMPDAGSSSAPDAEDLRSEISELRLKLARLESILEENAKTLRNKDYTLEEEKKLTEAMENDIQLLRNEESYSESNIYMMEDEVQILQQEVRKINNIAYTIESLAIDAEKRVEFLSSEVKKIESIITEQWIQIRQFEQAFVVTKMMTSKVHKRSLSENAYKWSGKDILLKYVRNVDLHGVFLAGVSHTRTCVSHTYKHCRSFIQVIKRCYHKASKFHKAIQYQCSSDFDGPNAFFLGGSISRSCISLPYKQFKISISSAQQIHYKVQVYLQDAMKSNSYSRGLASEPVTFCLAYLIVISPLWIAWFIFST